MKVLKADIRKCGSLDAVRCLFTKELSDMSSGGGVGRLRFTVEPNQFLDVLEIPASDDFKQYFNSIRHNTACLLLCKDDYSQMMFVMKEMGMMTGDNIYNKYVVDIRQPRNSDATRLQKIRRGHTSSFLELFNTKDIVSIFYEQYKTLLGKFQEGIVGIKSPDDARHYAQLLLSRIMFLYFIQARGFLSGNMDYLQDGYKDVIQNNGNFYKKLTELFFNVLNTEKHDRHTDNFDNIPFLNGGLFKKRQIEAGNRIEIKNNIFKDTLDFLGGWMWYVDDTTDAASTTASVNPEILGHIFETMIDDQHGKGAYYTPPDITRYICGESIQRYCVDRVNKKFGTEYNEIQEMATEHREYLYFDVIKPIKILDPACGSGEFILTAYKLLYELYKNIWCSISELNTKRVRAESKMLGSRPNYYFKRRIITENVYGVDIESGALEVCKLRLWLSLVADMDTNNIEPLPNIDYNIMQGNSIAGYFTLDTVQQTNLHSQEHVSNIFSEIEDLKRTYKLERVTAQAELLNKQINDRISVQMKQLNTAWVGDFGGKSGVGVDDVNPFHYTLHFHDVIASGGFDIIVGNPPWLSGKATQNMLKTIYKTIFHSTKNADDTYAYFFELSMRMLKAGGRIGFIVSLSSISTETKAPLTKFLRAECDELRISSYHDRPGKIFSGGNHARSAIILGRRGKSTCRIYTTHAHRWRPEDRPTLLSSLVYVGNEDVGRSFYDGGIIPKFGNDIEKSIMSKFLAKPRIAIVRRSEFVLYYHDSLQYWMRVASYKFKKTHVHPLYFSDQKQLVSATALLNSSLAYWFFNKTTDLKHVQSRMRYLCIGEINTADSKTLGRLVTRLNRHYEEVYPLPGEIKTDDAYCKPIMDKIDDVLTRHYGFTNEESSYIKNFQLSFRMK